MPFVFPLVRNTLNHSGLFEVTSSIFGSVFTSVKSLFRTWGMLSVKKPYYNTLIGHGYLYVPLTVLKEPRHFEKVVPSP